MVLFDDDMEWRFGFVDHGVSMLEMRDRMTVLARLSWKFDHVPVMTLLCEKSKTPYSGGGGRRNETSRNIRRDIVTSISSKYMSLNTW